MYYCVSISTSEALTKTLRTIFIFVFLGKETIQSGEAAVQRGGRNAKGIAASQHCAILWFLGITIKREEVHRSCDRANDLRDTEDVSKRL